MLNLWDRSFPGPLQRPGRDGTCRVSHLCAHTPAHAMTLALSLTLSGTTHALELKGDRASGRLCAPRALASGRTRLTVAGRAHTVHDKVTRALRGGAGGTLLSTGRHISTATRGRKHILIRACDVPRRSGSNLRVRPGSGPSGVHRLQIVRELSPYTQARVRVR